MPLFIINPVALLQHKEQSIYMHVYVCIHTHQYMYIYMSIYQHYCVIHPGKAKPVGGSIKKLLACLGIFTYKRLPNNILLVFCCVFFCTVMHSLPQRESNQNSSQLIYSRADICLQAVTILHRIWFVSGQRWRGDLHSHHPPSVLCCGGHRAIQRPSCPTLMFSSSRRRRLLSKSSSLFRLSHSFSSVSSSAS